MKNVRSFLFMLALAALSSVTLEAMEQQPNSDQQIPSQSSIRALIASLRELSLEEIEKQFDPLREKKEDFEKMALRLVCAQKHGKNLDYLKAVDFVTNITTWVNGWSYDGAKTLLFSQEYLPYVLPLLEVIIKAPVTGLDLTGNRLTSLPTSIVRLNKLQWLWLSGNNLLLLPRELSSLAHLSVLWVDDTITVPESIQKKKGIRLDCSKKNS